MLKDTYKRLYELTAKACEQCKSDAIALSGGLDSTILTHFLTDKVRGVTIIASDFVATDLTYCQLVSKKFGISLSINHTSTEKILDALQETIKILGNFNDVEIRNNVVMYLAIKWAKEQGLSELISGDGADELFAGYAFLVNKPQNELKIELERISNIMHFPAQEIGKSMNVSLESPFLNDEIIKFAKEMPIELKVNNENKKRWGKWILRKTFEEFIPSEIVWRPKSPMQDGAGTVGLTKLFDAVISDNIFAQKKKKIQDEDGINIRTKESMHYYEIYKKMHGLHDMDYTDKRCPYCKFNTGDSKFCRMCGAFPI